MLSISVVIPTHDRKSVLRRALESVFAQSRPPDEVVVVDDGSTDGTGAMVASEFKSAIYISQAHKGVSSARNLGIRSSRFEWLAFLDSDDAWKPEKLKMQAEWLESDDSLRICHCDEIWIRNGVRVNPKLKHRKRGGSIYRHCLPLCAISPSSVIMHRSIFDNLGGFDESLPVCEDYDMWLRVASEYDVAYVDAPLVVKYGGHPDQLSRAYPAMDRYRIAALTKILDQGNLSRQDRLRTLEILLEKLAIYSNGAAKRSRSGEAQALNAMRRRYAGESESLRLHVQD